jgi:ParB family chromosome partitioning protein
MAPEQPRRLGRGLDALFSAQAPSTAPAPEGPGQRSLASALRQVPIAKIRPNSLQPRKDFVPAELDDLKASISANGLLQPISLRTVTGGFELIAGERRFRAVQQLGWTEVPAIVKGDGEVSDKALLTLALVENLQRTDLNPIEEADGYQNLISQFSLTQQEVADVVGKDRSTVANTLRLLALPLAVRRMVQEGTLTIGHARALLSLGDDRRMTELANRIVGAGLNVREVERQVRETAVRPIKGRIRKATIEPKRPAEVARIEEELRRRLQTDVKVQLTSKDRGELRISFYSTDDLERLLDLVLGTAREAL